MADRLDHNHDHRADDARLTIAEANQRIERYVTGLEAGMDPHLVADRTRSAQAEVAAAQRLLASAGRPDDALTVEQVTEVLQSVWELRRS